MSVGSEGGSGSQRRLVRIETRGAILEMRGKRENLEERRFDCPLGSRWEFLLVILGTFGPSRLSSFDERPKGPKYLSSGSFLFNLFIILLIDFEVQEKRNIFSSRFLRSIGENNVNLKQNKENYFKFPRLLCS